MLTGKQCFGRANKVAVIRPAKSNTSSCIPVIRGQCGQESVVNMQTTLLPLSIHKAAGFNLIMIVKAFILGTSNDSEKSFLPSKWILPFVEGLYLKTSFLFLFTQGCLKWLQGLYSRHALFVLLVTDTCWHVTANKRYVIHIEQKGAGSHSLNWEIVKL